MNTHNEHNITTTLDSTANMPDNSNITASVHNDTDNDNTELVQRLNDEMAHLMIPAIVYISVLMVFGLLGNLMVCYYYGLKSKRTTSTFFIVVLAIYDIIVCAICMPTEIADIELYYTFENNIACKLLRFVNYVAGTGSILSLIAIAADRFKKLCKPTEPQMSMKTTKIISSVIFGVGLLLSWPSLVTYGSIKVPIPNDIDSRLMGSDCTTTKDRTYRIYVFVFNFIHVMMFFICSTVLIVLYSVIGKSMSQHNDRMRRYRNGRRVTFSTSATNSKDESVNEYVVHAGAAATISNLQGSDTSQSPKTPNTEGERSRTINKETIKLTMIMIVVTAVFIISFVPYLSLTIWRIYEGKHEAEFLSGGSLVAFKIGSRSFLLNSSLNPWVYGIFNSSFRRFFFRRFYRKS